jgi:hypothetical protein
MYGREGAVLLGEVLNFDHRIFSSIKPVLIESGDAGRHNPRY